MKGAFGRPSHFQPCVRSGREYVGRSSGNPRRGESTYSLKDCIMKRTLIAVAVALLASPALALEVGPPFEQNELDRELPDIQFAPVAPYVADARAPYEQLVIDR